MDITVGEAVQHFFITENGTLLSYSGSRLMLVVSHIPVLVLLGWSFYCFTYFTYLSIITTFAYMVEGGDVRGLNKLCVLLVLVFCVITMLRQEIIGGVGCLS